MKYLSSVSLLCLCLALSLFVACTKQAEPSETTSDADGDFMPLAGEATGTALSEDATLAQDVSPSQDVSPAQDVTIN